MRDYSLDLPLPQAQATWTCRSYVKYGLLHSHHYQSSTVVTYFKNVPAAVSTKLPSISHPPEHASISEEKRLECISDMGTSGFSLPPYGYTSRDPQVPTRSDIDDGMVPYYGVVDLKRPLPLSPLRRSSTPTTPPPREASSPSPAPSARSSDRGGSGSTAWPRAG